MRFVLSCSAAKFLLNQPKVPIFAGNPSCRSTGRIRKKEAIMFASIVRAFQEWRRYHQSLSELSRLGDRQLADIGVSRSDISRLARSSARKS
jgi:uncharacterized protein YjiS (DUF1127 family)